MKKCVLIGGYTKEKQDILKANVIDKRIVQLTEKEKPIFLFIGLASSYADSKYDKIKKIYQELNCTTTYLKKSNLIHNPKLVKEKIENADIIYIGGGDSVKLLNQIHEFNLEPLLRNAYERGCVLVGLSAGAIVLAKEGFSDSSILRGESQDYQFVKGMGFVPQIICPHYHEDKRRVEQLEKCIQNTKKVVFGIENDAALVIVYDQIDIISFNQAKVFKINYDKKYNESEIK